MHLKRISLAMASALFVATLGQAANAASVTLYDQDFETPNDPPSFVNGAGSGYDDLSQQEVNDLYGGQPAGFSFAQDFTVETMLLTGTEAFGTGYSDPSGQGGSYALGMLSSAQNDLLGLSFDIGTYAFFNLSIDVSSIGLSGGPGAPFTDGTVPPEFQFTLYDNPTGANGLFGNGTVLAQKTLTGTASAIDTFDWTNGVLVFDTTGNTNGNVTLQIDLLSGGYAAFDNMLITASDNPGEGIIPLPAGAPLLLTGIAGFAWLRRRKAKKA